MFIRLIATIVLPLTIGVAPGKNSHEVTVRKALQANYAKFAKAFQRRDINATGALLTDDYSVKQPGGQVLTRDQILQGFKQQMEAMHDSKWPRKITNLTFEDGDAIATVDGRFSGKTKGQDGKEHEFVLTATTRDTWTKVGDAWKLKSSEVQKMSALMDGKPPARGN